MLSLYDSHSESVNSLFIFAIFDETLRSIVLSPISTTKPPIISGLTYSIFSPTIKGFFFFFRVTYLCHDLELLALAVLRFCYRSLQPLECFGVEFLHIKRRQSHVLGAIARSRMRCSDSFRRAPGLELTLALCTTISSSPFAAPISTPNFSQTPCNMPSRLLSAKVFMKPLTVSPFSMLPMCLWSSCTI